MTNYISVHRWKWPLLWLIGITWLSTRGGIPLPGFHLIGTDKLAHAAAYGLWVWLALSAVRPQKWTQALPVALFAFSYGALMEWVQFRFFPDRFFEYDDMTANGIGSIVSMLFFIFWKNR